MYCNKAFGNYGEELACSYLIEKGYMIIDRNFTCRQGEIDIIALSGTDELVFVEVKTRKNLYYGMPSEAVNAKKRSNIVSSAKFYIFANNFYDFDVRFDVIEIFGSGSKFYINHLIDAF